MVRFEYNGRLYAPSNFEKKLKALGITEKDITILEDTHAGKKKVSELGDPPKYEYRINCNTVLKAYNEEQFKLLKSWYGIDY